MIYLLRHGQTVWNSLGRFQGQRDSPLTWRGITQARALGELLHRELPEPAAYRLVSSPLGRAWQTAAVVAETLGVAPDDIAHESRLQEVGFGDWEGRTRAEIEAADPGIWARRAATRWTHRPPGGETYAEVAQRTTAWLDTLAVDAKLIVVGHGLAGRILRGLYLGLPPDEIFRLDEPQDALFRLRNGAVERLSA